MLGEPLARDDQHAQHVDAPGACGQSAVVRVETHRIVEHEAPADVQGGRRGVGIGGEAGEGVGVVGVGGVRGERDGAEGDAWGSASVRRRRACPGPRRLSGR